MYKEKLTTKSPDLPYFRGNTELYKWVARYRRQPGVLRALIERHSGYYAVGIFDGIRNDMLRTQLWDVGITVVKVDFSLGNHEALLLRKRDGIDGGRGHTMILGKKAEWEQWPLIFAHELGHAWAPGTCGFELNPDKSARQELACEAFAYLWLNQPGNLNRARRFLRPLYEDRCRSVSIRENCKTSVRGSEGE